ncbi:tRNA 2-thiocytidine biosynthesis protein TtcA [Roseivivax sediminis]|uniref:tRNA 2-thiocytidine biosynthesis protein TtcA n=1 Tax=Roseivivax sediminis TaxID=936889 RepID=A0A1I1UI96_9RHOB|nr:tRNA 2-thiocytidine biosynthesis protein TtcA [Roseivivax sediminis]
MLEEFHSLVRGVPKTTEFKKLRKRSCRARAVEQYGMIERGARWLVCLSGGKDSYAYSDAKTHGNSP